MLEGLTCKVPNYSTWPEELESAMEAYPELKLTVHRAHPITIPADATYVTIMALTTNI
jgi:hypothetical protein